MGRRGLSRKIMAKSVDRLIRETARYAQMADMDITEADVRERYEDFAQRYGEERALVALRNTLADFKRIAKREESKLFCRLKAECLQRFGVAPANRRTLKEELRKNPGLYESVPAMQEYRMRFCC